MTIKHDHFAKGLRYYQSGQFHQAEQHYRQALEADPANAECWFLLGNANEAQRKLAEAAAAYRNVVLLNPAHGNAHYQLGNLLAHQGDFQQAAACYEQVVALQPNHAEAWSNLGVMLAEQRQFLAALPHYHRAIAIKPAYAEAHYNLGNALKELKRFAEAAECYREALRLRPGFAGALLNLGVALAGMGKPAEALPEYEQALRLTTDWVEAHNNFGLALSHLGRHDEALARYQRALDLRPDFPDAHYNRALSLLALGDFEQGWAEFEWRWRLAEVRPRTFSQPRWDGSPLEGRTILLYAEQGMGDTIQFIRYAPLVKERGGTVLVECQEKLLPLLSGCRGVDQWLAAGSALPSFDVHCPLMSLGRIFKSIPADIPYLFANAERVEKWQHELSVLNGFRIGIAWQGSQGYRWDYLRSIPLSCFAPFATVPGVRLVSLQKGPGSEQLNEPRDFDVIDMGAKLDEDGAAFLDTAAVMSSLDLIVTSDTATAHLAGAMGLPVWVVLSFAPEWRWQLGREDSPWYPTMRLFRQTRFGDWGEVFERVARESASGVSQRDAGNVNA